MSSDAPTPDVLATREHSLFADRYQLSEKLGEGGMGAVYRARDTKLDRAVAIKMLPGGTTPDPDAVARFRREAKALARLTHPGIIQAYDSGEEAGRPFLVMELVEGHSLSALLRDQGRVGPARAADFAYQAAQALHYAHKSGLVHRDVKPSNLLLSSDGRVRLLDLGLARFVQDQIGGDQLTHTGTGMGTPDYCPPEQFRDARKADARSDVYALGCMLYHLIAGRVPFPGSSFSEKAAAHESREPAPLEELCPDIPGGLALVVQRMMAKRPEDRFQSMSEVAEALMPYVAGSSASFRHIRTTSTWDGSRLATMPAYPPRRRVVAVAVAGSVATLLLLTLGVVGLAAGWFRPGSQQLAQNFGTPPGETSQANPPPADTGKGNGPDEPKQEGPKNVEAAKPADDPNVLTVSKDKKEGGTYRSIAAALEDVSPGKTVLVLDDGLYTDSLRLTQASKFENVTLVANRRATLAFPAETHVGVTISNVPGLVLRGFRLRADGAIGGLMLIHGQSAGVMLDDLDLDVSKAPRGIGVSLEGLGLDAGTPPVSIRKCRFSGGQHALRLSGLPQRCSRVLVQDNTFTAMDFGIAVRGDVTQACIVGNRFLGVTEAAVTLAELPETEAPSLIANNSFLDCRMLLRVAESTVKSNSVRIANNLVLGVRQPDMIYMEWSGRDDDPGKLGDGSIVSKAWQFDHNWRESKDWGAGKGWIPPDPKKGDVLKDKITGVNTDPRSPDFLRPDAKSPLATEGAGNKDPLLPCYIGALPPAGAEPWDWERAWRMPKDAKLLTVSKDSKDRAGYKEIGKALEDAKAWTTIRVLDREEYPETLALEPGRHEGIALEAPQGATLRLKAGTRQVLTVRNVSDVRIQGFRFRESEASAGSAFVRVLGDVPGVVLEGLDLEGGKNVDGFALADVSADKRPVVVRKCAVHVGYDGIVVRGPARGIAIRDNRVWGAEHRGINLEGTVGQVQVTGNRVWDCAQAAVQLQSLAAGSGPILIGNNTIFRSGSGFRVWDKLPHEKMEPRQVELSNNLLCEHTDGDMTYVLDSVNGTGLAGDGQALAARWRFRCNGRDFVGTMKEFFLPMGESDIKCAKPELLSRDPANPDFLRPASSSPLTGGGAGRMDPSLPAYIGALPPKGTLAWDWDRTWRMREKKTAGK